MARSRWRRNVSIAAGVVAAALALSYAGYRRDIDRAWRRLAMGSRVAATACGPIEYADRGEGPAVLLVHGAGGGFDQGLDLAAGQLEHAGFRLIAPSRFGYLRTPLPADASVMAQARAHACLLDALGVRRAAIMGASAGGPSALQFASLFPERTQAVVLLVPALFSLDPDRPAQRASPATMFLFDTALRWDYLFWAGSKLARPLFVRGILGTPPALVASASAGEQARVSALLEHILPVSPRRAGLLNDARVLSSPTPFDLARVTAPTLAISAADDGYGTFAGARAAAARIRGARFLGYTQGGHLLVGHQAAASAEIVAFLRASAGLPIER